LHRFRTWELQGTTGTTGVVDSYYSSARQLKKIFIRNERSCWQGPHACAISSTLQRNNPACKAHVLGHFAHQPLIWISRSQHPISLCRYPATSSSTIFSVGPSLQTQDVFRLDYEKPRIFFCIYAAIAPTRYISGHDRAN
jgi:hypothetical protein